MKAPAFQFYPKQWLGDDKVMLMDWDARAMHLHFMCIAWQQDNPCTLPDDDELLRRWVGNPRDWPRLKKQIFRAWKLENNLWIQVGLLREHEKQSKFSESRKLNASKRWEKVERKSNDASAMQVQCTGDALQSSITSTITKIKKEKPADAPLVLPSKEEIQESSDPKIEEHIRQVCARLYEEKIFPEVHAFKNKMMKGKRYGRVILHVLTRCYLARPEDPWGYCQTVISVEDGSYNERDYRKTAQ